MNFGERLRMLRKSINGLKLVDVAKETGLSVSFLSDMERGQTRPSIETIRKLAAYYEVSIDELLVDQTNPAIHEQEMLPAGLQKLTKEMNIEPDILDLMLTVEQRAKRQPVTDEDWKGYYYSLKTLLGR